jgi:iron complex transport system substrate-binding protein
MKQAERQPTWEEIEAAAAGAEVKWPAFWIHTYEDYAEQLERLTRAIEDADPNIGA